jgi:homoserine trans-succinylase
MSHTPPDLANLSPFKINTPARNAIEQEAQELLGNVELNVDGPAIEEGKNKIKNTTIKYIIKFYNLNYIKTN